MLLQALCNISLPLVNLNWSYSSETPNLGQIRRFLAPCDLEIWRMTLKNNRAPLLSNIKLYVSFHHHMWIQTGVTVRKRLSRVTTSVTLTFDLWPWPFAWTLPWSVVITPDNFMMIRWWEHSQKGVTDRQTDRQTDGRTDRQTENTIHRAAWSQLKIDGICDINVLRPRQNGRHFPGDILKCIFLNENVWISLKISLNFVPKVRINNIPALVQIMATSHYLHQWWYNLQTHICLTRPQWVNDIETTLFVWTNTKMHSPCLFSAHTPQTRGPHMRL